MAFSIVVALDSQRGIGIGNKIPWHLKADMLWFKKVTVGADPARPNAVIMGRKTWDSLADKFKPLPQRQNIVITRTPGICQAPHVAVGFEEALKLAHSLGNQIFVIGGSSIYALAMRHPELSELLITEIRRDFQCDHFFPDYSHFTQREVLSGGTESGLEYSMVRYRR